MPVLQLCITFDPDVAPLVNGNVDYEPHTFITDAKVVNLAAEIKDVFIDQLPEGIKYQVFNVDIEGNEIPCNRMTRLKEGLKLRLHFGNDQYTPSYSELFKNDSRDFIKTEPSCSSSKSIKTSAEDALWFPEVEDVSEFTETNSHTIVEQTCDMEKIEPPASTESVAVPSPFSSCTKTRLWKKEMRQLLGKHAIALEAVFEQMENQNNPVFVNGVDLFNLLKQNNSWRLAIAAATEPFHQKFTIAESGVFWKGVRTMVNNVAEAITQSAETNKDKTLIKVLNAFHTITGNEFFMNTTTLRFVRNVAYNRKKRSNRFDAKITKKRKLVVDHSNHEEVPWMMASNAVNVNNPSHLRMSNLDDNRTMETAFEFFEKYPFFKENILLIHFDFLKLMRMRHPKTPIVNIKSCLEDWSSAILTLAKKRNCIVFEETHPRLNVLRSLFALANRYRLCFSSTECEWNMLVHEVKSHWQLHPHFCILMQNTEDHIWENRRFSLSLREVVLKIPCGNLFEAVQIYFEFMFIFKLQYADETKNVMKFLERLCSPKTGAFTAAQQVLYEDLRKTVEEDGLFFPNAEHFCQPSQETDAAVAE